MLIQLPVFRADLYVKIKISGFDLSTSSEELYNILKQSEALSNLQMTKVKQDREEQGKIKIEEWYEMTGSINVPEGGKAFWVLCKSSSDDEPYNFFMRFDRNITAPDYDQAQQKAQKWITKMIIERIQPAFKIEESSIDSPDKLSNLQIG